ncbi:MAG: ABC transporter ATP-binding protein [Halobacteriovoraceae bacterium]|nr:ABC transporter ATP-binding protein [Halobacteriovoraceae bacterium]
MGLVQIKSLSKTFIVQNAKGKFTKNRVLDNIDLELNSGRFYGLLGRNGAGKSTLMKILMKRCLYNQGEVFIDGVNLMNDDPNFNIITGYITETTNLNSKISLLSHIDIYKECYHNWDQSLFEQFCVALNLNLNKTYEELSRGQKMQFLFAVTMSSRPKLVLLDEITSVLDAYARNYILDYLDVFVQEGGTVLMATNIVSEIQLYVDHILIIDNSKIKLSLSVEEIEKHFRKIRIKDKQTITKFESHEFLKKVGLNSDSSFNYLLKEENISLLDSIEYESDRRGISAEDLFIYFTGNTRGDE